MGEMFKETPIPVLSEDEDFFFPKSLGSFVIKAYISLTMCTLIIHPKDQSTNFLKPIYASISNKAVINGGISKSDLRKLIKNHDRVLMLGHGTHLGLLSVGQFPDSGSYIIDNSYSDLLSNKKENIFIWCHADQFVQRHGLNGFYSGMFISEVGEAFYLGYSITNRNFIKESNECFASIVSCNIHLPFNVFYKNVIHEYGILAKTNPIITFNLERLYLNSNHNNHGSNRFCKELPELP